jgi:hypothetical protein
LFNRLLSSILADIVAFADGKNVCITSPYIQYFSIAVIAKIVHNILNHIIVGRVFTVDDHINAALDTSAKMYSHHHCLPNNKPGNIIDIFVIKAKNSTVLGLFQ